MILPEFRSALRRAKAYIKALDRNYAKSQTSGFSFPRAPRVTSRKPREVTKKPEGEPFEFIDTPPPNSGGT